MDEGDLQGPMRGSGPANCVVAKKQIPRSWEASGAVRRFLHSIPTLLEERDSVCENLRGRGLNAAP